MSITTRRGDLGRTQLYSGQDVSKSDLPPAAVGALDEAVSVLGIARSLTDDADLHSRILELQRACFRVGAELATHPDSIHRLKERVDAEFLATLDAERDRLEAEVPMPKGFVIPGGTPLAAHLDHARTIFRRCERVAVEMWEIEFLENDLVLKWLNRASDLLWLFARQVEGDHVEPAKIRSAPKN
ncbi:MAG: cob(I)yrinic acid a,c-diamide adenosyltransferase [Verrucomicrobia bacterium]|nr:cob(I)yrinic acid a,c-diamide adenosyltransferase [Verrucomicrobiota bacterium]MCH8512241.1 cob(I)yrinic acid a,c-diamide adenosyltransferase [Kiritimatiellia bacterium]